MRTFALPLLAILAGCSAGGNLAAVPKEKIEWAAAPGLVSGMETSTQWGDPEKGPYQALIKFPAGYTAAIEIHNILARRARLKREGAEG